jgi:autotransporter-associated beta strand protein
MLPLAAGAAVALGSLATSAMGQTYTWMGGASGNFSVNGNWLSGSGPGAGTGSATTALNFFSGNGGAVTASNNNGTPFVANSISFNINNVNLFHAAGGSATGVYQLAGSGAFINSNGLEAGQLDNGTSTPNWGALLQLNANMTFGGTGAGNVFLGTSSSTGITEVGGPRSITVSGGVANPLLRNLVLNGNNQFSGGLVLDGGTVQIGSASNASQLGAINSTMTVTANGGTVNAANFNSTLGLGTLQLNGDLHVIGNNNFTLANTTVTSPAVVQGSGTLYVNTAGGGMQISSNSNAFTGAVVIDQSYSMALGASSLAGTLTLNTLGFSGSPLMGSLNGASSYDVRAGGTLTASSNGTNSFQNGDRISDTAPMRLRSGNFTLNGPAAAVTTTSGNNYVPTNLTEKIGDVSGAGANNITVAPTASTNVVTTLDIKSLTRLDRGVFNFRSNATTMGDGATATRGRIILDNLLPSTDFVGGGGSAGSKNISILTYGAADKSVSNGGTGFVTYGADGFRMLNTATEYDNNPAGLATADPTNNVRVADATITNNATQTMNSLLLGQGTASDGNVAGTGTLNITSGAVMSSGGFQNNSNPQSISNNLAFGNAEAVIWSSGFGGLKITGNMTGSNGLTRAGVGQSNNKNTLILTGDNSGLTGQLTMSGGHLEYTQDLALPGTGQIVANGAGVSTVGGNAASSLAWAGTNPTTLTRDVVVNTGTLNFRIADDTASTASNLGNYTVAGTLSGTGNYSFQPQSASSSVTVPGEIFITNTANTYTGTTRMSGGTVHIAADGSTGIGGQWDLGSTLVFEGPVTNSRTVNFEGTQTLDTKANNVTLNGPITSFNGYTGPFTSAGLTKNGTGTLTLSSLTNTLSGLVTVNAGTLLINGNLGPSNTSNVSVFGGATLGGSGTIYRNSQIWGKTGAGTASNPFVISGNATLSPGSNGPGILTVWGSVDLAPAKVAGGTSPNIIGTPAAAPANLSMELNGPVAGTGYDQIQQMLQNQSSAASVILGDGTATWAANLQLSLGYAPSASDVFWLIVNSNTQGSLQAVPNTTTGTFAGLPEGSTVTLGTFGGNTYTGTISYKGDFDSSNPAAGTGNDVVIYNVVPAPGSISLIGIGGLLATRRKRRMA